MSLSRGRIYPGLITCHGAQMFQTVQLPLWLLVLILAFAAVTALSHFLLPSVRWFFRRRMERVVARLNERLERPIEPFKLARRHDMIQRLSYDAKVMEAVTARAKEAGIPEDVAFQEAQKYAREIVPSFSASAYFGIAIKLARWISQGFYRVRLGYFDAGAIAKINPDSTVVFIMNHRSNMDYVLVTYLAAERSALSYAVGEWARVWPLSRLIKAMGAYFIRRKSRNDLYRRVLARYVQLATAGGVAQAVFPEGGLSLNGKVGDPKLGLLNYIVSDFDPKSGRDVSFVPVALNYDRVFEDRVLVAAADAGVRKFRFRWTSAVRYLFKHLYQRLTGGFLRFGYAAVSFGEPLSLAEFSKGKRGDQTKNIGRELMKRIRAVVPVLPLPLVCYCLLNSTGPLDRQSLIDLACEYRKKLQDSGAHIRPKHGVPEEEINVALNHLLMRKMITEDAQGVQVNEKERNLVVYYANTIAHLF